MNAINHWLESFVPVEQLGWTLMYGSLVAAIVGVLFWMMDKLVSRRTDRSEARYALSVCGLLCMVLAFPVTFLAIPTEDAERVVVDKTVVSTGESLAGIAIETPVSDAGSPLEENDGSSSNSIAQVHSALRPSKIEQEVSDPEVSSALAFSLRGWFAKAEALIRPWLRTLVVIWALGVLVFMLRTGIGIAQVNRLRRTADFDVPDWLKTAFAGHARRLAVTRARVALTSRAAVPAVVGIIRPIVLLPIAMVNGLSAEQTQSILAHELAHVRRHDNLVNLLQVIAETLLFFHPAVWWISARVRTERENCCDDLAIVCVGDRKGYLQALLELEQFVGRSPALGSAGTGGSLLHRFRRLSRMETQDVHPATNLRSVAACLLLSLLVVCSVTGWFTRPAQAAPQQETPSSESETGMLRIVAVLKTADEEPVANTGVKLTYSWEDGESNEKSKRRTQELSTDSAGKITATFKPPTKVGTYVYARFAAQGHTVAGMNRRFKSQKEFDFGTVLVSPTRSVTSRVVDPFGQPVAEAKVRIHAILHGEYSDWFTLDVKTDAKGLFQAKVPADLDIGVAVKSKAGAYHRVVFPADTPKWPDLFLRRGVKLSGRVLDRDGKPIVGCIVRAESDDPQAVGAELEYGRRGQGRLEISTIAITDETGRYEFTPLLGDFLITLASPKDCFRKGSEEYERCVAPPPLLPTSIRLDSAGTQELNLIESPTAELSGVMNDHSGKPVEKARIVFSLPPMRGLAYTRIAAAQTDAGGHYKVRLPLPLGKVWIRPELWRAGEQARDKKAWPTVSVPGGRQSADGLWLTRFDGSLSKIDWQLLPKDETPDYFDAELNPRDRTSSDPLVAELEKMILQTRNSYREGKKAAKDKVALEQLEREFGDLVIADRLIAFEEKHRGTRAALGAIRWIMLRGAQTLDNEMATRRTAIVSTMIEHYAAHYDLDRLWIGLDSGNPPPNGPELLNVAIAKSPHPHVRAEAMYLLAEYKLGLNRMATMVDGAIKSTESLIDIQTPETQASMRRDLERYAKIKKALAGKTIQQRHTEAIDLLDVIVSRYGDVSAPVRWFQGPADVDLQLNPDNSKNWYHWTPARRAEVKKFQINRLVVGKEAPEIEGTDLYHRPIRLSDYRGKAVVLTVNSGTVGEKEMYKACKELLSEFDGEDVAVISVITSDASGGYSVRDIVRETGITWPIIRDTRGERIIRHWCKDGSPVAYLITPDGKIKSQSYGYTCVNEGTKNAVAQMLK